MRTLYQKNGNFLHLQCFVSMARCMYTLGFWAVFHVPRRMTLLWLAAGQGRFCATGGGAKLLCAARVPPALLTSLSIHHTASLLPSGSTPHGRHQKSTNFWWLVTSITVPLQRTYVIPSIHFFIALAARQLS